MIEDKFGAELLGPQLPESLGRLPPLQAAEASLSSSPFCLCPIFLPSPLPTFPTEAGGALGLGLAG